MVLLRLTGYIKMYLQKNIKWYNKSRENGMENYMSLITAVLTLGAALAGFGGFISFKSKRDRQREMAETFSKVAKGLSSQDHIERLTSAALLSRFYGRSPSFVKDGVQFEQDAVRVCVAVLKSEPVGVVQKALADGLAQASSLRGEDFQRTNLRNCYWGRREDRIVAAPEADFFHADLSMASLKGADLKKAVFYGAQLVGSKLNEADLRGCNFGFANLRGSDFTAAKLQGATFENAQHVPAEVQAGLDGSVFVGETAKPSEAAADLCNAHEKNRVFISSPSALDSRANFVFSMVSRGLADAGVLSVRFPSEEYGASAPLDEVKRRIADCDAMIVLGFSQITASTAKWRANTPQEKQIDSLSLATPWNHIESGIAVALDKPILVIRDVITPEGVFDVGEQPHAITIIDVSDSEALDTLNDAVYEWAVCLPSRQP
jgi:uncharacterized protein YjbI with pentapeptide repeats